MGGLMLSMALACQPAPKPLPGQDSATIESAQTKGESRAEIITTKASPKKEKAVASISSPEIQAAKIIAQDRLLIKAQPPMAELAPLPPQGVEAIRATITESDSPRPSLPGYFVPLIDEESPPSISRFYGDLKKLEKQSAKEADEAPTKVRLLFYGASGTAADLWTAYVRNYLQARFGKGGPGMVSVGKHNSWSRHHEVSIRTSNPKHWRKEHPQIQSARKDGLFGIMGASMSADSSRAWVKFKVKRKSNAAGRIALYELFFLKQPGGGSFDILVDGKRARRVDTDHESTANGRVLLKLPPSSHEIMLRLKGNGEVRFFGMSMETEEPGIVLDTLGINGAHGDIHLGIDEELWREQVQARNPSLYLLAYGTNESVLDPEESIDEYERKYREVIARFKRALPSATCVLFAPGDFPIRDDSGLRPRKRISEIIEVQKRLAHEKGCAFWNGRQFMGGELSMEQWVHSQPPLAKEDYLHFNRLGYLRLGMGIADALMYGYDAGKADAP